MKGGGDAAQPVQRRTVRSLTQVRFPRTAREFSPRVNFQCRLSYVCSYTPMSNHMHQHLSVRTFKIL